VHHYENVANKATVFFTALGITPRRRDGCFVWCCRESRFSWNATWRELHCKVYYRKKMAGSSRRPMLIKVFLSQAILKPIERKTTRKMIWWYQRMVFRWTRSAVYFVILRVHWDRRIHCPCRTVSVWLQLYTIVSY